MPDMSEHRKKHGVAFWPTAMLFCALLFYPATYFLAVRADPFWHFIRPGRDNGPADAVIPAYVGFGIDRTVPHGLLMDVFEPMNRIDRVLRPKLWDPAGYRLPAHKPSHPPGPTDRTYRTSGTGQPAIVTVA